MQKPPEKQPPPKPTETKKPPLLQGKGRFVGLIATGKERYQAVVIETVDGVVVKMAPLTVPKSDSLNGVVTHGDVIQVASMAVSVGVQKYIRDRAAELWK